MSNETRKAQYRAYYHRHLEANRMKAREREAKRRAARVETPEQAEERRRLNREWYARKREERRAKANAYAAKRRGDEPLPDVSAMSPQRRRVFMSLVIGLLAQRHKQQLARRRDWAHKRYGTHERKPAAKAEKVRRVPMTAEQKKQKATEWMRVYRNRPEANAKINARKRIASKLALANAKYDPVALKALREKRRLASLAWLDKMKRERPEDYRAYQKRMWLKTKARRMNPQVRFACALRTKVAVAIRRQQAGKKSHSTEELTGCTMAELVRHIENQFTSGMTWENFGKGRDKWSIDHVRPLASFRLTDESEQRQAFHWSNLAPRWLSDNISKGSFWNGRHWRHSDHSCTSPQHA